MALNAVHFYRAAHYCHERGVPIVPRVLYYLTFLVFNSSIPYTASIGEGSRFAYGGIGVVLHADTRIGRNVMIGQGITIGGRSRAPGAPDIGDDVYIGAGARILGPVRVGAGSLVAPNAVVIGDVPEKSIVGGIPAKVLKSGIDIADYV